jgi:hypothetical protein
MFHTLLFYYVIIYYYYYCTPPAIYYYHHFLKNDSYYYLVYLTMINPYYLIPSHNKRFSFPLFHITIKLGVVCSIGTGLPMVGIEKNEGNYYIYNAKLKCRIQLQNGVPVSFGLLCYLYQFLSFSIILQKQETTSL